MRFLHAEGMENTSYYFQENGGGRWGEFLENHILHKFGLYFHFFSPQKMLLL